MKVYKATDKDMKCLGLQYEIGKTVEAEGDLCAGKNCKARGPVGTWITLAEYDENGVCLLCKSERIDGKTLKENTWYTLRNGVFVEVEHAETAG